MNENTESTVLNTEAIVLKRMEAIINTQQAVHEKNVSKICRILCGVLGVDAELTDLLCRAAELHDIGKLAIPGDSQLGTMREHTRLGRDMLTGTGLLNLDIAASVALNHHERYDGSGYPSGLKGLEIPMSSRIIAICDVYDELRLGSPERRTCPHSAALDILTVGDGRHQPEHFDPRYLEAFLSVGNAVSEAHEAGSGARPKQHAKGPQFRFDDDNCASLSKREFEVLKLVALGLSNKEIARKLVVGVRSVETYRLRASQKLGLRTRADAVRYAIGEGWLRNAQPAAAEV